MNKIFSFFLIGFFTQSKSRFFLSLLSITLGIALFTSTRINSFRAEKSLLDQSLGFSSDEFQGSLSAQDQKAGGNAEVLKELYFKLPEGIQWHAFVSGEGVLSNESRFRFAVIGRDLFKLAFEEFSKSEKTKSSDLGKGEIFLSESLYQKAFAKSQHISIEVCGKNLEINSEQTVSIAKNGLFLLADLSWVQEHCGNPENIQLVLFQGDETRLAQFFSDHTFIGWEFQTISSLKERANTALSSLKINLTIVSLISVLISFFMVSNSLTGIFLSRKKEMGIYLSLGVSRVGNFFLFLSQSLLLGLIGSFCGFWLGKILCDYPLFSAQTTLTDSSQVFAYTNLPIETFWMSIALGIFGAFFSSLFPAYKAFRIQPIELVRDGVAEDSSNWKRYQALSVGIGFCLVLVGEILTFIPTPKSLILGLFGVGIIIFGFLILVPTVLDFLVTRLLHLIHKSSTVSAFLAWQEIKNDLLTSSLTCATMVLSIALVFTLSSLTESYEKSILDWVEADSPFHGSLIHEKKLGEGKPGVPIETEIALKELDFVTDVEPFVIQPKVAIGNNYYTLHAYPFPEHLKKDQILVSTNFCFLEKICESDSLELNTEKKGKVKLKIQGVKDHFFSERGTIIMDLGFYLSHFQVEFWNSIRFKFKDEKNLNLGFQKLRQFLAEKNPDLNVLNQDELKQIYVGGMKEVFRILESLKGTAILLSLLTLVSALVYNTQEKSKILAGLRAMGLAKFQLFGFIFHQALFLGGTGGMLGAFLSFFLSPAVIFGINRNAFGWTLSFTFPWIYLPIFLLLLPFASLLVAYLPFYQESRKTLREALQYE